MNVTHKFFCRFEDFIFDLSQLYLYFFAVTVIMVSALFFIGIPVGIWSLPLSAAGTLFLFIWINGFRVNGYCLLVITVALIVFCLSAVLMAQFFDASWDGNHYHKPAVGLLKDGWMPPQKLPESDLAAALDGMDIYIECYPKASWFYAATLYASTGNIECGKIYTILAMFCAFGITLKVVQLLNCKKIFSWLFALCAALNPIALSQFTTYYVDGFLQVMVYIVIMAFLLNIFSPSRRMTHISYALIFSGTVLCTNIKFTGALFAVIYCLCFFIARCVYDFTKYHQQWRKKLIKNSIFFIFTFFIAVFVVGGSTYITNYIRYGHIGHPIMGIHKKDIMSVNSPFEHNQPFKNLFYSLFSYPDNYAWSQEHRNPELKIPFSYSHQREKDYSHIQDLRIGGFGPLFSGLFVLSLLILGISIIMGRHRLFILILLSTSTLLCCLITVSWWARYAPYLYFLVLGGIMALYMYNNSTSVKYLANFLCVILLINNLYFVSDMNTTIHHSRAIFQAIDDIKPYGRILYNPLRPYTGTYYNMRDAGLDVTIDTSLSPREGKTIFHIGTAWSPMHESRGCEKP